MSGQVDLDPGDFICDAYDEYGVIQHTVASDHAVVSERYPLKRASQ